MEQVNVTKQSPSDVTTWHTYVATFDSTQKCMYLSRRDRSDDLCHHKVVMQKLSLWPNFKLEDKNQVVPDGEAALMVELQGMRVPTHEGDRRRVRIALAEQYYALAHPGKAARIAEEKKAHEAEARAGKSTGSSHADRHSASTAGVSGSTGSACGNRHSSERKDNRTHADSLSQKTPSTGNEHSHGNNQGAAASTHATASKQQAGSPAGDAVTTAASVHADEFVCRTLEDNPKDYEVLSASAHSGEFVCSVHSDEEAAPPPVKPTGLHTPVVRADAADHSSATSSMNDDASEDSDPGVVPALSATEGPVGDQGKTIGTPVKWVLRMASVEDVRRFVAAARTLQQPAAASGAMVSRRETEVATERSTAEKAKKAEEAKPHEHHHHHATPPASK